MSNQKRLFALLLCIGLVLMLTVSSAYIVLKAGHPCCGRASCEICETVAKTEAVLHGMLLFALVLLPVFWTLFIPRGFSALLGMRLNALSTLVRWKVRLND